MFPPKAGLDGWTYLESVLTGEALVAVAAGERLDGKMYALVSLEVVIPIEALRTLVASEWSVVRRVRLCWVMRVHLLHRGVSTGVWHCHAWSHAVHECKLATWVADVG